MFSRKFAIGLENTFATWRNGDSIKSSELTALLRSDVLKGGLNHGAYSLSIPSGRGGLVIFGHKGC